MPVIFVGESHIPRKVKIGNTNFYTTVDETLPKILEADKRKSNFISELIEGRQLKCSLCGLYLNPKKNCVLMLDQDDIANKPILLHIFCSVLEREKWKNKNKMIVANSRVGEIEIQND